jgi:hypothetical protein
MTDQGRSARMSAYATASSHLALLSDLALERVVDEAPRVRPGIGGTSATLEVEGVRVFVKQVPVTERELLPGNVKSTANLTRYAGTAVILNDFHQSLMERSKQTPYPRAELERIRARAGQREGLTTDIA